MTEVADVPAGHRLVAGELYMVGAKGELVPPSAVKPALKLQDDTVRSMFGRAEPLAAELAAFKQWAFEEVDTYCALLEERWQTKPRGDKGNMTLFSFDGLLKVIVQRADRLVFGPEIQMAKQLIVDELVPEWSVGANANLVALVQNAFRVDAEGNLNRYAILGLRRLEVDDERWKRAMEAIGDSERVVGSSRYVRFYKRADNRPDTPWIHVSLNLATA